MKRAARSVASNLMRFERAIAAVLPRGLPKDVRRFYAKTDGLVVTIDGEKFVIVGLAGMFDGLAKGVFRKHVVAKRADVADLDWSALPHYERFFTEHGDIVDKRSLDQLNLRMRLKLLASVAGESTELAIDLESGALYLVDRADHAYELNGLSFDDFVAWFSKFGTRRWYFAFLDKKAEERMNIDLRTELERSLAEFPANEWAPLLARLPAKRVRGAEPVKRRSVKSSTVDPSAFPALNEPPLIVESKDSPRQVWFAADGRMLLVADGNYGLSAYGIGSREQVWKQTHADVAAPAPDGRTIAVLEHASASQHADRLVVRDVATGKPLHAKPWRPGVDLATLGWIGGGKIVVADTSATLHVIDAATLTATLGPKLPNVRRIAGARETSRLLAHVQKYDAGTMRLKGASAVQLIDMATGNAIASWKGASTFAVSPDGSHAALRFVDKKSVVRIIELASQRVVGDLTIGTCAADEDESYGFHLAFSGDGSLLAIADRSYDPNGKVTTSAITAHDATTWAQVGRALLGTDPENDRASLDAEGLAVSRDHIVCASTGSFGLRFWHGSSRTPR